MISKKSICSTLLTTSLLFMTGCTQEAHNPNTNHPNKLKQNRTILETISNPYGKGGATLFITNNDENFIFYLTAYGDIKRHKQLYIDLDKSGDSGYTPYEKNGIGAEYLIEDNKLFKFIGKNNIDWAWEYIDTLESPSQKMPFLKVPFSYFDTIETFNVQAIIYDAQWQERFPSALERATKIINPTLNTQEFEDEDFFLFSQDSLNYYFAWENNPQNTLLSHRQFFIDSDQNPYTGYDGGADYLIEDKRLFKYNGEGDLEWNWVELDRISLIENFTHLPNIGTLLDTNFSYQIVPKKLVQEWNETLFIKAVAIDEEWEHLYTTPFYRYDLNQE